MKLVTKETKEKKKTLADVEKELQTMQKQLAIECNKCDGTGRPRTKTGEPAKTGKNVECKECFGAGVIGNRLDSIETSIVELKRELKRVKSTLDAHINKQSVEIKVLPEGHDPEKHGYKADYSNESRYTAEQLKQLKWKNGWVDYSGKFDLDNDEEMSIVIGKAMAHFDKYFKDGFYHRNKKLGVFLSNATTSGKRLIEEFQTEE